MSIENDDSDVTRSDVQSKANDIKSQKMYSLIPDLITGWKPKGIKIPSPVLIKYKSHLVAQLIDYYEDCQKKIIYIGTPSITQDHATQTP